MNTSTLKKRKKIKGWKYDTWVMFALTTCKEKIAKFRSVEKKVTITASEYH